MKEDEVLIGRASAAATGATVHNINGMIGAYRSCVIIYRTEPNKLHKSWLAYYTRILEIIADTGAIPNIPKRERIQRQSNWNEGPPKTDWFDPGEIK